MIPITVVIKKPLSVSNGIPFVSIRDKTLLQAIRQGRNIRVITSLKIATHDPEEWMRTGKLIKKTFKFIDNPMTLYANYI